MNHTAHVQFRFEVADGTNDADRAAIRDAVKADIQSKVPKSLRDAWADFQITLTGTEAERRTQWQAALDQFVAEWSSATGGSYGYDYSSIRAVYWVVDSEVVCQHYYSLAIGTSNDLWIVDVDLDDDGTPDVQVEVHLAIAVRSPCT